MVASAHETSHIKRPRRTKGDMGAFYDALLDVVADQQPMTVRQVFSLIYRQSAQAPNLDAGEHHGNDKIGED